MPSHTSLVVLRQITLAAISLETEFVIQALTMSLHISSKGNREIQGEV